VREISFLADEHKTFSIVGYNQIKGLQIVFLEEISTSLNVCNVHNDADSPLQNKSPWIYPRALLSAIVHDYFLNRGVPGSADMIPSACEPVFLSLLYPFPRKNPLVICTK
jgi:hypothetical protein